MDSGVDSGWIQGSAEPPLVLGSRLPVLEHRRSFGACEPPRGPDSAQFSPKNRGTGTGRAGPAPSLFPLLPKFPEIGEFHFNFGGFPPLPPCFSSQSFVPGGGFSQEAPLPVPFPWLPLSCALRGPKKTGSKHSRGRVCWENREFQRVPVPGRVPSPGQVTSLMSSR